MSSWGCDCGYSNISSAQPCQGCEVKISCPFCTSCNPIDANQCSICSMSLTPMSSGRQPPILQSIPTPSSNSLKRKQPPPQSSDSDSAPPISKKSNRQTIKDTKTSKNPKETKSRKDSQKPKSKSTSRKKKIDLTSSDEEFQESSSADEIIHYTKENSYSFAGNYDDDDNDDDDFIKAESASKSIKKRKQTNINKEIEEIESQYPNTRDESNNVIQNDNLTHTCPDDNNTFQTINDQLYPLPSKFRSAALPSIQISPPSLAPFLHYTDFNYYAIPFPFPSSSNCFEIETSPAILAREFLAEYDTRLQNMSETMESTCAPFASLSPTYSTISTPLRYRFGIPFQSGSIISSLLYNDQNGQVLSEINFNSEQYQVAKPQTSYFPDVPNFSYVITRTSTTFFPIPNPLTQPNISLKCMTSNVAKMLPSASNSGTSAPSLSIPLQDQMYRFTTYDYSPDTKAAPLISSQQYVLNQNVLYDTIKRSAQNPFALILSSLGCPEFYTPPFQNQFITTLLKNSPPLEIAVSNNTLEMIAQELKSKGKWNESNPLSTLYQQTWNTYDQHRITCPLVTTQPQPGTAPPNKRQKQLQNQIQRDDKNNYTDNNLITPYHACAKNYFPFLFDNLNDPTHPQWQTYSTTNELDFKHYITPFKTYINDAINISHLNSSEIEEKKEKDSRGRKKKTIPHPHAPSQSTSLEFTFNQPLMPLNLSTTQTIVLNCDLTDPRTAPQVFGSQWNWALFLDGSNTHFNNISARFRSSPYFSASFETTYMEHLQKMYYAEPDVRMSNFYMNTLHHQAMDTYRLIQTNTIYQYYNQLYIQYHGRIFDLAIDFEDLLNPIPFFQLPNTFLKSKPCPGDDNQNDQIDDTIQDTTALGINNLPPTSVYAAVKYILRYILCEIYFNHFPVYERYIMHLDSEDDTPTLRPEPPPSLQFLKDSAQMWSNSALLLQDNSITAQTRQDLVKYQSKLKKYHMDLLLRITDREYSLQFLTEPLYKDVKKGKKDTKKNPHGAIDPHISAQLQQYWQFDHQFYTFSVYLIILQHLEQQRATAFRYCHIGLSNVNSSENKADIHSSLGIGNSDGMSMDDDDHDFTLTKTLTSTTETRIIVGYQEPLTLNLSPSITDRSTTYCNFTYNLPVSIDHWTNNDKIELPTVQTQHHSKQQPQPQPQPQLPVAKSSSLKRRGKTTTSLQKDDDENDINNQTTLNDSQAEALTSLQLEFFVSHPHYTMINEDTIIDQRSYHQKSLDCASLGGEDEAMHTFYLLQMEWDEAFGDLDVIVPAYPISDIHNQQKNETGVQVTQRQKLAQEYIQYAVSTGISTASQFATLPASQLSRHDLNWPLEEDLITVDKQIDPENEFFGSVADLIDDTPSATALSSGEICIDFSDETGSDNDDFTKGTPIKPKTPSSSTPYRSPIQYGTSTPYTNNTMTSDRLNETPFSTNFNSYIDPNSSHTEIYKELRLSTIDISTDRTAQILQQLDSLNGKSVSCPDTYNNSISFLQHQNQNKSTSFVDPHLFYNLDIEDDEEEIIISLTSKKSAPNKKEKKPTLNQTSQKSLSDTMPSTSFTKLHILVLYLRSIFISSNISISCDELQMYRHVIAASTFETALSKKLTEMIEIIKLPENNQNGALITAVEIIQVIQLDYPRVFDEIQLEYDLSINTSTSSSHNDTIKEEGIASTDLEFSSQTSLSALHPNHNQRIKLLFFERFPKLHAVYQFLHSALESSLNISSALKNTMGIDDSYIDDHDLHDHDDGVFEQPYRSVSRRSSVKTTARHPMTSSHSLTQTKKNDTNMNDDNVTENRHKMIDKILFDVIFTNKIAPRVLHIEKDISSYDFITIFGHFDLLPQAPIMEYDTGLAFESLDPYLTYPLETTTMLPFVYDDLLNLSSNPATMNQHLSSSILLTSATATTATTATTAATAATSATSLQENKIGADDSNFHDSLITASQLSQNRHMNENSQSLFSNVTNSTSQRHIHSHFLSHAFSSRFRSKLYPQNLNTDDTFQSSSYSKNSTIKTHSYVLKFLTKNEKFPAMVPMDLLTIFEIPIPGAHFLWRSLYMAPAPRYFEFHDKALQEYGKKLQKTTKSVVDKLTRQHRKNSVQQQAAQKREERAFNRAAVRGHDFDPHYLQSSFVSPINSHIPLTSISRLAHHQNKPIQTIRSSQFNTGISSTLNNNLVYGSSQVSQNSFQTTSTMTRSLPFSQPQQHHQIQPHTGNSNVRNQFLRTSLGQSARTPPSNPLMQGTHHQISVRKTPVTDLQTPPRNNNRHTKPPTPSFDNSSIVGQGEFSFDDDPLPPPPPPPSFHRHRIPSQNINDNIENNDNTTDDNTSNINNNRINTHQKYANSKSTQNATTKSNHRSKFSLDTSSDEESYHLEHLNKIKTISDLESRKLAKKLQRKKRQVLICDDDEYVCDKDGYDKQEANDDQLQPNYEKGMTFKKEILDNSANDGENNQYNYDFNDNYDVLNTDFNDTSLQKTTKTMIKRKTNGNLNFSSNRYSITNDAFHNNDFDQFDHFDDHDTHDQEQDTQYNVNDTKQPPTANQTQNLSSIMTIGEIIAKCTNLKMPIARFKLLVDKCESIQLEIAAEELILLELQNEQKKIRSSTQHSNNINNNNIIVMSDPKLLKQYEKVTQKIVRLNNMLNLERTKLSEKAVELELKLRSQSSSGPKNAIKNDPNINISNTKNLSTQQIKSEASLNRSERKTIINLSKLIDDVDDELDDDNNNDIDDHDDDDDDDDDDISSLLASKSRILLKHTELLSQKKQAIAQKQAKSKEKKRVSEEQIIKQLRLVDVIQFDEDTRHNIVFSNPDYFTSFIQKEKAKSHVLEEMILIFPWTFDPKLLSIIVASLSHFTSSSSKTSANSKQTTSSKDDNDFLDGDDNISPHAFSSTKTSISTNSSHQSSIYFTYAPIPDNSIVITRIPAYFLNILFKHFNLPPLPPLSTPSILSLLPPPTFTCHFPLEFLATFALRGTKSPTSDPPIAVVEKHACLCSVLNTYFQHALELSQIDKNYSKYTYNFVQQQFSTILPYFLHYCRPIQATQAISDSTTFSSLTSLTSPTSTTSSTSSSPLSPSVPCLSTIPNCNANFIYCQHHECVHSTSDISTASSTSIPAPTGTLSKSSLLYNTSKLKRTASVSIGQHHCCSCVFRRGIISISPTVISLLLPETIEKFIQPFNIPPQTPFTRVYPSIHPLLLTYGSHLRTLFPTTHITLIHISQTDAKFANGVHKPYCSIWMKPISSSKKIPIKLPCTCRVCLLALYNGHITSTPGSQPYTPNTLPNEFHPTNLSNLMLSPYRIMTNTFFTHTAISPQVLHILFASSKAFCRVSEDSFISTSTMNNKMVSNALNTMYSQEEYQNLDQLNNSSPFSSQSTSEKNIAAMYQNALSSMLIELPGFELSVAHTVTSVVASVARLYRLLTRGLLFEEDLYSMAKLLLYAGIYGLQSTGIIDETLLSQDMILNMINTLQLKYITISREDVKAWKINSTADHFHCELCINNRISASAVMKSLLTRSSDWFENQKQLYRNMVNIKNTIALNNVDTSIDVKQCEKNRKLYIKQLQHSENQLTFNFNTSLELQTSQIVLGSSYPVPCCCATLNTAFLYLSNLNLEGEYASRRLGRKKSYQIIQLFTGVSHPALGTGFQGTATLADAVGSTTSVNTPDPY